MIPQHADQADLKGRQTVVDDKYVYAESKILQCALDQDTQLGREPPKGKYDLLISAKLVWQLQPLYAECVFIFFSFSLQEHSQCTFAMVVNWHPLCHLTVLPG